MGSVFDKLFQLLQSAQGKPVEYSFSGNILVGGGQKGHPGIPIFQPGQLSAFDSLLRDTAPILGGVLR